MGKVKKGIKCSVSGCEEMAVKSVPEEKAYLCKLHWKLYKKKSEQKKRLERLRWKSF